jgi:D-3-phosphoglycerate dehydrogenase / 2-oxoglutarate reductase
MPADERPVLVVADPIPVPAFERLRAAGFTVVDATAGAAALEPALPSAWGLLVRSRTKVDQALLSKAPRLRFVGRAGVGVDNIDVPAASARGIVVANAPSAATASVAELTVGLLLALARNLYPRIADTKAGGWKRSELGGEIAGKTVGFVGYGRIAREVAKRLVPFGVRTIAYDPFVRSSGDATEMRPLEALLPEADFVCLHAALTPENRHLFDAARIATMRPGAYLVNVARGPLVDEAALLAALNDGRLAGAALDVFEAEPPTQKALLEHPKVIATPHLGASTREGQERAGLQIAEEAIRARDGKPLEGRVNPSGGSP